MKDTTDFICAKGALWIIAGFVGYTLIIVVIVEALHWL